MSAPMREPRRYAKPIALPETLASLAGPTRGVVRLPRHLKWSGNARYDLDQPGRIIDLYRTVINEAMSPADLEKYLNQTIVISLWKVIWLPPPVRYAWEQRFPELAELRSVGVVA